MKDWAIEKGATHFTHLFQPMTGLTAEKHDSFLAPDRRRRRHRRVQRQGTDQGRAGRQLVPVRRPPRDVRGPRLHRLGPDQPGVHHGEPQRRDAGHPDRVPELDRRGARQEDAAAPLDGGAVARRRCASCELFGNNDASKVFTTVGPEQEYFLIDKNFYYARPDLINGGRTLFGAKPPKGQELEDQYFGAIPERVLACMADVRGGAVQARRAGQDAAQRGRPEPVRDRADLRELATSPPTTRTLIMEILRKTADKYGLVCLLHEKPFAGINGSGKHNNWSMSTDTGENLLNPGDNPHDNAQFLVFCVAVIRAVAKYPELLRVVDRVGRTTTTASGRTRPRRRSSRSSWATSSSDVIEQLEKGGAEEHQAGRHVRDRRQRAAEAAARTPATATAPARSRSPATSSSSAPSASRQSIAGAEHGAQHDRRRVARLHRHEAGSATSRAART